MADQPNQSSKGAETNRDEVARAQSDAVHSPNIQNETAKEGWHPEEQEHKRHERRYWRFQYIASSVTLLFSFTAAIGAITGSYIAYQAFIASTQAVAEAKRQADAAYQQIDVAKDTEERQLRAYVFATKSEIRDFGSEKLITAIVDLKNFGQTPAYQLQRRMDIGFGEYPTKKSFTMEQLGAYKSDVGPTDDVYLGPLKAKHIRTAEQISEIVAGRAAVYIWGAFRYVDAFDKLRCTKFRLLFKGDGTPIAANSILPLEHAEEGNEADKNCEKVPFE